MWAGIGALRGGAAPSRRRRRRRGLSSTRAADGLSYGILEDYVGHGIGRQMHEDPPVPNYRVRDRGPDGPVRAVPWRSSRW